MQYCSLGCRQIPFECLSGSGLGGYLVFRKDARSRRGLSIFTVIWKYDKRYISKPSCISRFRTNCGSVCLIFYKGNITRMASRHCRAFTRASKYPAPLRSIENNGTIGSFSRVKCSWKSRAQRLTKLAIEKTPIDADVSFLMLIFRWVMWYSIVRVYCSVSFRTPVKDRLQTVAIETQAGSSIRGSSDAPERYNTQEVI